MLRMVSASRKMPAMWAPSTASYVTLPAGPDDAPGLHGSKQMADRLRGDAGDRRQVAHAQQPADEGMQDAPAGRIGERTERLDRNASTVVGGSAAPLRRHALCIRHSALVAAGALLALRHLLCAGLQDGRAALDCGHGVDLP